MTSPLKLEPRTARKIEWFASLTALLGAFMVASNSVLTPYGFFAYLASNAGWLVVGLVTRSRPMVLMQMGFIASTVFGVASHFKG